MAQASFSIGQVNITGYLRVIAREVSNPTAEVSNLLFSAPHPTTRNIVVNSLNPVPHYFDFYETPGAGTLGTLLGSFFQDVGLITQSMVDFLSFVVDRGQPNDPVSGTNEYVNTQLQGCQLQVSQRGFGPYSPDEISILPGGGFRLPTGYTFGSSDTWFIVAVKATAQPAPIVAKNIFEDIIQESGNFTITTGHYNRIIEATGGATVQTATIADLNVLPNLTQFEFNTHSFGGRYLAITVSGGNIKHRGSLKTTIWLGKYETLVVVKKGANLVIVSWDGDHSRVGEKVKGDIAPSNSIAEQGGWLLIADYPRLYFDYVSQIPPGQLSAIAAGNVVEPTKWAIDSANNRFWVPDTGGYFERNVDINGDVDTQRTERYTGSAQDDAIKTHEFPIPIRRDNNVVGTGTGNGAAIDLTLYNTDPNNAAFIKAKYTGATETRVKNVSSNTWRII